MLLVAAGYVLAGKLSQLLALPSGYVSIIWLPAGVALAALLVLGYPAWLGVALGAFTIHGWRLLAEMGVPASEAMALAAGLALGAVAQAAIGAWIVRRYAGCPGPLDMVREIVLFLVLGCGLASLVSAVWGPALLVLTGALATGAYLENVAMWWLGDALGAVILVPVLLTMCAEPRDLWRSRRVSLGIPLVGVLVLAIISFALVRDREIDRLSRDYEHRAIRVVEDLVLHFQRRLDSVHSIASMIQVEGNDEPRKVAQFAGRVLDPLPGVLAILWLPRSPQAEPGGSLEPTIALDDEPDAGYQVRLSAWRSEAEDVLGQEVDLVRQAREAMCAARDSGAPVATAPMDLKRDSGTARALLVFMPVYQIEAERGPLGQTVAARRQSLRGFVAELLLVDPLIEEALHGMGQGSLAVRLWDHTDAGQPHVLYARDARGPMLPYLQGQARSELAGRHWRLLVTPAMAAVSWRRPWDTWVLLVAGLLVAVLLGALLLLVSGHTARVQTQASEHARALSQAQHTLQEAAFLRRLANSNIIGIMIVDPSGKIHDANDAVLDMLGYSREDLTQDGLRWDELTPPEWEEADRKAVEHSMVSDSVPAWEKEYLRKDGSRVPIMMGVARLEHDDSRHVAFVVDLTQVKEAEAELKRRTAELENYKLIINSTPIAVYVKEYSRKQQGVYALANPKAAELMGKAQPVGCTDRDWLPDDLCAEVEAHDRDVIQSKKPGILEERLFDAQTGQMIELLSTRVPLFDAEGEPYAIAAVALDITEARRTREALQQTNARLQAANEELKEFAYVASHDLQEPLRTVRSFAELLERRYAQAFDERGRKWLDFIVSGTERMQDLIEDLLAYSRAGRTSATEPVDTKALVAGILDDSRASIEAAGAEVEVGELPTVMANETELRQVFLNLISNALKFQRPDTTPRVVIAVAAMDEGWRFSVADNGIGIEPGYHDRIFQVFQRLHARDEYPGTGIGLALVKKIVERQGGEISVRSAPGEGTEFRFTWLASPSHVPAEPGAQEQEAEVS